MSYAYSQIDRGNLAWFDKDDSKATLLGLEISEGRLRGLENLKLQFKYPITAISGKNGTGKSTILACIACAFHNSPQGFKTLESQKHLLHVLGLFRANRGGGASRLFEYPIPNLTQQVAEITADPIRRRRWMAV